MPSGAACWIRTISKKNRFLANRGDPANSFDTAINNVLNLAPEPLDEEKRQPDEEIKNNKVRAKEQEVRATVPCTKRLTGFHNKALDAYNLFNKQYNASKFAEAR